MFLKELVCVVVCDVRACVHVEELLGLSAVHAEHSVTEVVEVAVEVEICEVVTELIDLRKIKKESSLQSVK